MTTKKLLLAKLLLSFIITFFALETTMGQSPERLPYMYLKSKKNNRRLRAYPKFKERIINAIIKSSNPHETRQTSSFIIPYESVKKLIASLSSEMTSDQDHIMIQFGAFTKGGCPQPLQDWANLNEIVLIYSKTKSPAKFYGFKKNGNLVTIDTPYKDSLVNNYLSNIMTHKNSGGNESGLLSTIDITARENQEGNPNDQPSDTRFISYCWRDFLNYFNEEVNYQDNQPGRTTGYTNNIKISLASMSKRGIAKDTHPINNEGKYKKRLHVLFALMHNDKVYKFKKKGRKEGETFCPPFNVGGDNGQLCPNICNQ